MYNVGKILENEGKGSVADEMVSIAVSSGEGEGVSATKHVGVHTNQLSFQKEDLHVEAVKLKEGSIMQRDGRLTLHTVTRQY